MSVSFGMPGAKAGLCCAVVVLILQTASARIGYKNLEWETAFEQTPTHHGDGETSPSVRYSHAAVTWRDEMIVTHGAPVQNHVECSLNRVESSLSRVDYSPNLVECPMNDVDCSLMCYLTMHAPPRNSPIQGLTGTLVKPGRVFACLSVFLTSTT
jgi:hypothetical protein